MTVDPIVVSFAGNAEAPLNDSSEFLGGKGAGLVKMSRLGIPVPPGFIIPVPQYHSFQQAGGTLSDTLTDHVRRAVQALETRTGKGFGNTRSPLIVSVRSGAPSSMPGMMDTVLNLGMNEQTCEGLAAQTQNREFAWSSYLRLVRSFAEIVFGIELSPAETTSISNHSKDVSSDWKSYAQSIVRLKHSIQIHTNQPFPEDPYLQLFLAVKAVFKSCNSVRANSYRDIHGITGSVGTAVTVQTMVFGNLSPDSATGVVFSRNPSNGAAELFGEYLPQAQGEDVVAGTVTPLPISCAQEKATFCDVRGSSLETRMPDSFQALSKIAIRLENHFQDMQDIEFTIEAGQLWILQTRNGKRTNEAEIRIAVEMANEGKLTKQEAIWKISPDMISHTLHPSICPNAKPDVLATGLPASPGAAWGQVVFTSQEAIDLRGAGKPSILVRTETSPEDICGMNAAEAILTSRGGMTSHAAVVARGMGKPCVCGANQLTPEEKNGVVYSRETIIFKRGDIITIDGRTGRVLDGKVPTTTPRLPEELKELLTWADQFRRMEVRANAETPTDVRRALEFGAQGVGLCRTEHMFFGQERAIHFQRFILAASEAERNASISALLPMQTKDFTELFRLLKTNPCAVRLLDPPLHEFLPGTDAEFVALARLTQTSEAAIRRRKEELAERNPMLGHRGCRLCITHPELVSMQVQAIFTSADLVSKEINLPITPEILVPLVGSIEELDVIRLRIDAILQSLSSSLDGGTNYRLGAMIELPRAALIADELAKKCAFLTIGSNDLTQTTFGMSRDDSSSYSDIYREENILRNDPFSTLDIDGVGQLIKIATSRSRSQNSSVTLGLCGEHGGDPDSIEFCDSIGLDYISCSPYRIPSARLVAAQSALRKTDRKY